MRRNAGRGLVTVVAIGLCFGLEARAQTKAASFEEALSGARYAGGAADLAQLFDPLFADCKRDDDVSARQCVQVRDYLIERLRNDTFWTIGDDSAISWAPYDPSEKKLELDVQGCIACTRPLTIEGKMKFVSTRVPKAIKAGKVAGLDVKFHDVPQPDEKSAAAWQKKMQPRLRVQWVFRVGPVWKSGAGDKAYEGVTFIPVAHRIFDKCNGKVIASDPPSSGNAVAMKDASCPDELTDEQKRQAELDALPVQLSPKQINQTLSQARDRVRDCYAEFQVAGTAVVKLHVDTEGKIEYINLTPPFDKTPTGYCIRTALKGTMFPRFKGEKMLITYPFQLK